MKERTHEQPYGNLVNLNTCRTLVGGIGEDVLGDIVSDFLDLLDTSSAVYEKNGDYAIGIFTSSWFVYLMALHVIYAPLKTIKRL